MIHGEKDLRNLSYRVTIMQTELDTSIGCCTFYCPKTKMTKSKSKGQA